MRTRIALATAPAVIAVSLVFSALFGGAPTASAGGARHDAVAHIRAKDVSMKLMSYDKAHEVAQFVAYTDAVETHEIKTYLTEVAYLRALAAANDTIPAAWMPTAICEEGGRDDPVSGYFGIKEWDGFDGYPTAGSAPLSVQLAWEADYIGGPPDAPGQCHSY